MQDLEYQVRFVNCLMNHYRHDYEVHVFTDVEELKVSNLQTYSSVIMDEYTTDEMANFVEGGMKLLCLTEAEDGDEKYASKHIVCTEKYQEVYKITEHLQQLTAGHTAQPRCSANSKRTVVFSLTKEQFQIPLSALLAELYGENARVLVLDLQPLSGFDMLERNEPHMGLEDILTVATTGNYSRGRLLECIGHASNWDYVYPVRNTECLVEGDATLYLTVLEILEKELGYERIVINFGAIFPGWLDLLAQCDNIYFLRGKEMEKNWREYAFRDALERKGRENLCRKVKDIEIPAIPATGDNWQNLLDRWRYASLGEHLRTVIDQEKEYGTIM